MAEIRVNGSVTYNPTKYEYYLTYEVVSQDTVLNQTTLRVKAYARKKSTYSSYTEAGTGQIQIDGTNYAKETGLLVDLQANTNPQQIGSARTKVITHNADGTKIVTIKGGEAVASGSGILGANDSSYSPYKGTATGTFALPTIPREASISDATLALVIGNDLPINLTNAGALYVQVLTQVWNGSSFVTKKTENLGAVTSATLDLSTIASDLYAECPNALTVACNLVVKTYTDNTYTTQVGVDKEKTFTASVNQATNVPTIGTVNFTGESNVHEVRDSYNNLLDTVNTYALVGSVNNRIIKGYNLVKASITEPNKMEALNSATPSYYLFANGTKQDTEAYNDTETVNLTLDDVLTDSCIVYAYDSRGLQTNTGHSFANIANYVPINLTSIVLTRDNNIDAPTNLVVAGTSWAGYFGGGSNGTQNAVTMHYRYKESTVAWGAQTWNAITATVDGSGNISFNDHIDGDLGAGGFNADKAYDIEVRVYDKLTASIVSGVLSVGTPLVHKTKYGYAFGAKHTHTAGNIIEATGKIVENGEWIDDIMDTKDNVLLEYIKTGWFPTPTATLTPRVQAYTNDPASGANIVLNMTDTSDFQVGDKVWVWSSAGNDVATVTAVSTNTSITVDNLATNHTTTGRAIYHATTNYTFVITTDVDLTGYIGVGDKIKFTQDATTKYGIVVAITSTKITIFGGTDYSATGVGLLTNLYVGKGETPLGFPHNPHKWQIEVTDTAQRSQTNPVSSTIYNLGSLGIIAPIGHWIVNVKAFVFGTRSNAGGVTLSVGLSTANNTFSNLNLLGRFQFTTGGSATFGNTISFAGQDLIQTSKAFYYLNEQEVAGNVTQLAVDGAQVTTILTLECAYL